MPGVRTALPIIVVLALSLAPLLGVTASEARPDWGDVGPIFAERCVMCHSDKGAGRDLRLDSYGAVLAGSINGPVVLAGHPERSEMIRRLRGESRPRMPFLSYPLPDEQIDLIYRWIEGGALEGND